MPPTLSVPPTDVGARAPDVVHARELAHVDHDARAHLRPTEPRVTLAARHHVDPVTASKANQPHDVAYRAGLKHRLRTAMNDVTKIISDGLTGARTVRSAPSKSGNPRASVPARCPATAHSRAVRSNPTINAPPAAIDWHRKPRRQIPHIGAGCPASQRMSIRGQVRLATCASGRVDPGTRISAAKTNTRAQCRKPAATQQAPFHL
jgi:hypothetical protein